jgi:type II secretion system protein G
MWSDIHRKRGFTLIELLVVMVLLSILVAVATGGYASSSRRGRDNRRKNDLRNIATALEAYYSDKGVYPTSNSNGQIVGCEDLDLQVCEWGGEFVDQHGTLYMVLMPKDPGNTRYFYVSGTTNYKLYAKLENTLDEGNGVAQSGYSGTNCANSGTVECTYGISSSNTSP